MPQTNIPEEDHIVRFVPWKKVRKDADDNVTGITAFAFETRPTENGLSVNWLERAAPSATQQEQLIRTYELMSQNMKMGGKARLVVSNVGTMKQICANRAVKIRIVHIPETDNEPHSEIKRLPRENLQLLEILANEGIIFHRECNDIKDMLNI